MPHDLNAQGKHALYYLASVLRKADKMQGR